MVTISKKEWSTKKDSTVICGKGEIKFCLELVEEEPEFLIEKDKPYMVFYEVTIEEPFCEPVQLLFKSFSYKTIKGAMKKYSSISACPWK